MNIKIHVEGHKGSGKTALINAIIGHPAEYAGLAFRNKVVNDSVTISFFESAQTLDTQCTKGESGTILVVDITNRSSFESAQALLKAKQSRRPYMIVATHSDERIGLHVISDAELASLGCKFIKVDTTNVASILKILPKLGEAIERPINIDPKIALTPEQLVVFEREQEALEREQLAAQLDDRITKLRKGSTYRLYSERKDGKIEALLFVQKQITTTKKKVAEIVVEARATFPEIKMGLFLNRTSDALDELVISARRKNL